MFVLILTIISCVVFRFCEASLVLPFCNNSNDILCKGIVLELLHGIRIIKISNQNLTELPQPGSLNNLKTINRLDFSNNSISEVKNGVFNNTNFVTVDLSFNQINNIESDAFDDMPELRYLNLDFNRIGKWNADWFKNNKNLHQITFRNNLIKTMPPRAFQNIKWIHNYDLFLRIVTIVDLSQNKIQTLHSEIFGDETEIGRLNFANNSVKSVPKELFSGVEYVEELDFSYNQLECDTIYFLLNLGKLDTVNMKYQNVY